MSKADEVRALRAKWHNAWELHYVGPGHYEGPDVEQACLAALRAHADLLEAAEELLRLRGDLRLSTEGSAWERLREAVEG